MFRYSVAALVTFVYPRCPAADRKIAPKVIVLAGFEVGEDTGDAPGEFQYWAEREKLTGTLEVPGAPHPLRYNAAGVYGCAAGNTRDTTLTTVPASELIMSLCLDPRLDLRKTYWIINGISGIDPAAGSIGSAVWAANVLDGDAMRDIGESEMPKRWPYRLFAIGNNATQPAPKKAGRRRRLGWRDAHVHHELRTQRKAHAVGL